MAKLIDGLGVTREVPDAIADSMRAAGWVDVGDKSAKTIAAERQQHAAAARDKIAADAERAEQTRARAEGRKPHVAADATKIATPAAAQRVMLRANPPWGGAPLVAVIHNSGLTERGNLAPPIYEVESGRAPTHHTAKPSEAHLPIHHGKPRRLLELKPGTNVVPAADWAAVAVEAQPALASGQVRLMGSGDLAANTPDVAIELCRWLLHRAGAWLFRASLDHAGHAGAEWAEVSRALDRRIALIEGCAQTELPCPPMDLPFSALDTDQREARRIEDSVVETLSRTGVVPSMTLARLGHAAATDFWAIRDLIGDRDTRRY